MRTWVTSFPLARETHALHRLFFDTYIRWYDDGNALTTVFKILRSSDPTYQIHLKCRFGTMQPHCIFLRVERLSFNIA